MNVLQHRRRVGEVRTRVRPVNATDQELARRGELEPDRVCVCLAEAMMDTGCVRRVIPPR